MLIEIFKNCSGEGIGYIVSSLNSLPVNEIVTGTKFVELFVFKRLFYSAEFHFCLTKYEVKDLKYF